MAKRRITTAWSAIAVAGVLLAWSAHAPGQESTPGRESETRTSGRLVELKSTQCIPQPGVPAPPCASRLPTRLLTSSTRGPAGKVRVIGTVTLRAKDVPNGALATIQLFYGRQLGAPRSTVALPSKTSQVTVGVEGAVSRDELDNKTVGLGATAAFGQGHVEVTAATLTVVG